MTNQRLSILLVTVTLTILLINLLGFSPAKSATLCETQAEVPQAECEALVAFYNNTDGPNWIEQGGWLVTDRICSWQGVTCHIGLEVNIGKLDLSSKWLRGQLPAQLGNLAKLDSLDLSENRLSGSIPAELGKLTNLSQLDLGGNQLSGSIPAEFGNLTKLGNLFLRDNQLGGSIPAELGDATNLIYLDLANNHLDGNVPPELGNLTNLASLHLGGNQLSGSIPAELGNLAKLDSLDLSDNQLSGSIPAELGKLTNLSQLDLGGNQLSGSIPAEFGNLTKLGNLFLRDNQLGGSIPAELGDATNLIYLDLANNHLDGNVPPELGNLTNLASLHLGGNQLSGSIPAELGNLTKLGDLILGDNQLDGSIPAELGDAINLIYLNLANNHLNGNVPPELGNLTNLIYFNLSNNQLIGRLPLELTKLVLLGRTVPGTERLDGGFWFNDTNLCELDDPEFQKWLNYIAEIGTLGRTNIVCDNQPSPHVVVLVHGYNDDASSWNEYIGFLREIGMEGKAVDTLDTGKNKWAGVGIHENAALLKAYINEVITKTGVSQVDIIAHSMGGLIARAYIHDNKEDAPKIRQLIMLGTPNGGANTANLLFWFEVNGINIPWPLPYELTPNFMASFNNGTKYRYGIPFYAVAGNYFKPSPISCLKTPPFNLLESFPNDVVVAYNSVFAIPVDQNQGWIYPDRNLGSCEGDHRGMRSGASGQGGRKIFDIFVKPLLQGKTPIPPPEMLVPATAQMTLQSGDPQAAYEALNAIQFTAFQTETLYPGQTLEFTSTPESGKETTFAVMGQPKQMTVSLRDPAGRIITPTTTDPQIQYMQMDNLLLITSYTISNPVTGAWTTIVEANNQTPATGVMVAAVTSAISDLRLTIPLPENTSPQVGAPITVVAQLQEKNTPIVGAALKAILVSPDDARTNVTLLDDGQHGDGPAHDGIYGYQFTPAMPGIYSAGIEAAGVYNGLLFSRSNLWVGEIEGQVVNHPPYIPSAPTPTDGSADLPVDSSLTWSGGDPDGDVVTYTLALGEVIPPPLVATTTQTMYHTSLKENTTYYWYVTAKNDAGSSEGPVWSFTTRSSAPPSTCDYVVQPGDWIFKIARHFGVSPDALIKVNGLCCPNCIYPGQCLIIPNETLPAPTCDYVVQPGDWIFKIAQQFGVSAEELMQVNYLYNPNQIYAGQCLIIPRQ